MLAALKPVVGQRRSLPPTAREAILTIIHAYRKP